MKRRVPRRRDWRLKPAKRVIPAMTKWQMLMMGVSRAAIGASDALLGFADTISVALAVPIFHKSAIERSREEDLVARNRLKMAGEWWLDDAVGLPGSNEARRARLVGESLVRTDTHVED